MYIVVKSFRKTLKTISAYTKVLIKMLYPYRDTVPLHFTALKTGKPIEITPYTPHIYKQLFRFRIRIRTCKFRKTVTHTASHNNIVRLCRNNKWFRGRSAGITKTTIAICWNRRVRNSYIRLLSALILLF